MPQRAARCFHHDAEKRENPDDAEHGKAAGIAQRTEGKWRIRSRNQQKNRRMIHYLEKGFHARLRPGVIERRPEVHEQHRHSKNDRPDKKKGAGMAERCQKQNRRADHRSHDSYRVTDTIRQFLCP